MTPKKRDDGEYWFSVQEAADVLGVTRQAVYAAISSGFLSADETEDGKQIQVQPLVGYGIQVGKNPVQLVEKVKLMTGADMKDLLLWVLAGLGLIYLVKALLGK